MTLSNSPKIGVIDLGTSSARLFVFEVGPDCEIQKVDQIKDMIRLGDDLYEDNCLSKDACERASKAFQNFRKKLDKWGVQQVSAVATSALRDAKNADEFIDHIKSLTDIKIEVISGEEEAELVAKGVLGCSDMLHPKSILIDIGGGSTEIIFCREERVEYAHSLPIGASRGQQVCLKQIPPSPQGISELQSTLKEELNNLPEKISQSFKGTPIAVGSSGSIRAFGRMFQALNDSSDSNVFSQDFLNELLERMFTMEVDQIRELPELESRRIDLILSAGIILNQILEFYDVPYIAPSPFALKDGLALRLAEETFG